MSAVVNIVGGGFAGAEAVWQCACRGIPARLFEMRPAKMTPAHETGLLAEPVCSNSFKSEEAGTAPALLKEEMARLGSLVLAAAQETRVPAGGALAVDRRRFAEAVTARVAALPGVEVVRAEVVDLPAPPAVIASGPLTSDGLAAALSKRVGRRNLFFFDALAPIVSADSVDASRTFRASRYGKGFGGYVNCPLTAAEYRRFVAALAAAEKAPVKDFERGPFFEGCVPAEELAARGEDALRFGPMKPVGLTDAATGRRPYAVMQLRAEDEEGRMLGLVGFQTRLRRGDQRRVFRMVPALAGAEFLRYGAAHRNTYICSPAALAPTLALRGDAAVFVAGQLTGVEGYMESAATGILAGINAARRAAGEPPIYPPPETALGALLKYVTAAAAETFAPMNVNFGLLPDAGGRGRRARRHAVVERARASFAAWLETTAEGC